MYQDLYLPINFIAFLRLRLCSKATIEYNMLHSNYSTSEPLICRVRARVACIRVMYIE
jgi:hypothetical protein